jgi:hypothetical protein
MLLSLLIIIMALKAMKEDIYIEYNDIEWVDNDSMSISIIMYTLIFDDICNCQ